MLFLSRFPLVCCTAVWFAATAGAVPVTRLPVGEPPLRFRNLTTEDGLPINDVRAIERDARGFMWFGTTQAGLCRYDGYTVKSYQNDPTDPRSLPSNGVWTILSDRAGRLWIATNGGLSRYDERTDSFTHFRHDPQDETSLPHNNVLTLFEDGVGELWVGTRRGLSRFDRATGRFTTYRRPPHPGYGANIDTVRCLAEEPGSDLLWVGASDGLGAFDRRTGKFLSFLRPAQGLEPVNSVNAVIRDGEVLWVLTEKGLLHFRPGVRAVPAEPAGPVYPEFGLIGRGDGGPGSFGTEFLRSGLLDRRGRFWVGSKDGLFLFDRATGRAQPVPHSPYDTEAISDTFINRIYEDPAGSIWVGTRYGGAARLRQDPFATLRPPLDEGAPRAQTAPASLLADRQGRLWIGTAGGLFRLSDRGWEKLPVNADDPAALADGYVTALAQDRAGDVWAGTFNAGLHRWDGARFHRYRRPPGSTADPAAPVLPFSGDQFTSLLPEPGGALWIGARAYGIDRFDGTVFRHLYARIPGRPDQPTDYAALGHVDAEGGLWYGTHEHGLIRLQLAEDGTPRFERFLVRPEDPENPANKAINCVYPDGVGHLWVGNPGGLAQFDLAARRFVRSWSRRDGFADDTIMSVVADAAGQLWIGTNAGLTRLDPRTGECRNFTLGDGLIHAQMAIGAAARLPDGRLAFGSLGGVVLFDPSRIVRNDTPPPVAITAVRVLNREVRPGDAAAPLRLDPDGNPHLDLAPDQNVVSFQFAALDFTAPLENRYAYKLEGFDADWHTAPARNRTAVYTNLPRGSYVFRVRGANNHGAWNESGATLRITVHPPWWATWWAQAAAVLLAGGGLLSLSRWRERRIAQRNVELERQVEERRQAEAIVRVSEERFRALYEDNPAMYFTLDADGSVLSVNRFGAQLLGFEVHELNGRPVTDLFHPDDRPAARRELEACLARPGELVRLEARKITKDGRLVWVKELARAIRGADGRPVVLVVCEDVTARVELESRLRQAQKMEAFGQLAGGVAHDFNNILSVVLGQAQLAQDPGATPAEQQESLADITQAALRARNLTRQLLAFSRRQAMLPVAVDLNQVVQNLARMLERLLGEPIALVLDLAAAPVPVLADVAMLEQVLVNLAVNARDAMPRGGKLVLRTRLPASVGTVPPVAPGFVRLDVEDTGAGVPADVLPRLFEPFFTTKEVGKGTGLGLATSLGIVQQHRGSITVLSPPGAGATFRIELPLHREALAVDGAAPDPRTERPRGHETILLVEDEAPVRASARRVLERAGYRVLEATDGEDGLRVWERHRATIDLVLTDVVMPGAIMGRDLVARLRALEPTLRFGFMSGYAPDTERTAPPTAEDRAALLPKPFEIDALLRFVRERLGSA